MIELSYARRAERRAVDLSCDLIARHWDEPLQHLVSDISPFGLWLRTALPLKIGEQVVLSFKPPFWRGELCAFAAVKRSVRQHDRRLPRPLGMALEFLGLSREERRALQFCLRGLPSLNEQRSAMPPRVAFG